MTPIKSAIAPVQSKKLESIQIARAIAVLVVVLYHSHFVVNSFPDETKFALPLIYKYGYLGVELFFCISGFIVAHITSRNFNPAQFFARRFFRIYPVYSIFTLLAIWLLIKHGYTLGSEGTTAWSWAKSLLILPQPEHPHYAVGWSLEHEILFYLLAGAVLAFWRLEVLIWILAALSGVGVVLHILIPGLKLGAAPWDLHLASLANLCFLAGVLVWKHQNWLRRYGSTMPLLIFVTGFCTMTYAAQNGAWLVAALVLAIGMPLASVALLVGLLNLEHSDGRGAKAFWRSRLARSLVLVGNVSFSLYLVHWILFLEMGRARWRYEHFAMPDWMAEPYRAAMVLLAIAFAWILYKVIEQPFVQLGHRVKPTKRPTLVFASLSEAKAPGLRGARDKGPSD
jgi:peptidoglycan/LPS O-acetylase OafA/YrhL